MAQIPLPVLVSIPHGGLAVPACLQAQFLPGPEAVLADADTWSRELYCLHGKVAAVIDTDIARLVLDLNRSPQDRPPKNPDGVVKTRTVAGERVWQSETGLSTKIVDWLIETYHKPYHSALAAAAAKNEIVFGLDCHTMLPVGSPGGASPGKKRPGLCISNGGNGQGEPVFGPVTMPPAMFRAFCDALAKQFSHDDLAVDRERELIGRNDPFRGGYIVQNHGIGGPIPWVQIEINRGLYLPDGAFTLMHPDTGTMKRMTDLQTKLLQAVKEML